MRPEPFRSRTAIVHMGEDGILRNVYLAGAEETLADAQEGMRIAQQLSGGRRTPLLVDMRVVKSQHRDARAYYNGPEAMAISSAVALLVGSRISTLIANFFIAVDVKQHDRRPIRLFTDEAEALAWLKGFVA
jgi:hypothetical protein